MGIYVMTLYLDTIHFTECCEVETNIFRFIESVTDSFKWIHFWINWAISWYGTLQVGMMPGEARTEGFWMEGKDKILVVENFLLPLWEELKKIVFVKVIMAVWLTSWMVQTGNQWLCYYMYVGLSQSTWSFEESQYSS